MNERKLSTSDVLGMGILSRPTLKSQCPEDVALITEAANILYNEGWLSTASKIRDFLAQHAEGKA